MPWNNYHPFFQHFLTESGLDEAADGVKLAVLYDLLGGKNARVASDITKATKDFATTIHPL